MKTNQNRRDVLRNAAVLAVAVATANAPGSLFVLPVSAKAGEKVPEVTATEDLMREHGVIRRALLVYFETVPKLRRDPSNVDPAALRQTAQLFRTFGEDYHERMLEEQHIFPLVRKQGGELQRYADILTAQHNRGREITDYVLAVTNGSKIGASHAEPLAKVFESFVLMYENHAAREDTIVVPRGKRTSRRRSSTKSPNSSKISSTKCSGKLGLRMPRRRSAISKESWGLLIFRSSHRLLHRKFNR